MNLPAAPQRCIACDLIPAKSFRLSNGAELLRCPRCRLGWWDWPVFQPAELYNQNYFQSASTRPLATMITPPRKLVCGEQPDNA